MKKRLLLPALCVLAFARAFADTLSPEAFTGEFVAALRAALPDHQITVPRALEVRITGPEGMEATAFLQNAFDKATRAPADKDAIIEQHVGGIVESASDTGGLKPANIVPVIKDRGWLEESRQARKKVSDGTQAMEHVVDDFNEDLVVVYAEDTPRNTRYFTAEQLAKAGVDRQELRALALGNLDRILPEIELHQGENVSMLTAGADYVSSLLLIDELWSGDRLEVDGEIVVAVPSREMVLFTGSRNNAGVRELRKLAREVVADSSYSLTDQLFVYRDGRFVRFKP